jgi:hypothetical protein
MKPIGFVLVILGTLSLLYGGVRYSQQTTVLEVGGFKATATEQRNVPVSPLVGGGLMLGGGALVLAWKRRPA